MKELEKTGRPVVKARVKNGELVCFSGTLATSDEAPSVNNLHALAFAGIASPESFIDSLKAEGITVEAHRFFGDHKPYSERKLKAVCRKAGKKGLSLITTEKDYFRMLGQPELIRIITSRPCYYLKIETDIFEGRERLQSMLKAAIGK